MGKKRIKLIDNQPETKKAPKIHSGKADEARLSDMGQKALEDLEKIQAKEKKLEEEIAKKATAGAKEEIKAKTTKKTKIVKFHSKRYQNIKKNIASNKKYPAAEALALVLKNANAGFDEAVDVHLGLYDKLSGSVSLPYGSQKQRRIAIADEALIDSISNGKVDFDVLIASPQMMSKLAKVAKILGPKGLMPNPKAGTITDKPEELKKKLESSKSTAFKTEAKAPLLHFSLGKVSLGQEKLLANLEAFLTAVKKPNIIKAVLCSTMGPGVKLDLASLS